MAPVPHFLRESHKDNGAAPDSVLPFRVKRAPREGCFARPTQSIPAAEQDPFFVHTDRGLTPATLSKTPAVHVSAWSVTHPPASNACAHTRSVDGRGKMKMKTKLPPHSPELHARSGVAANTHSSPHRTRFGVAG